MDTTAAKLYLKEKQVLSAEESSLQISFSDGRPSHDLAELLAGFADYLINDMGARSLGGHDPIQLKLSVGWAMIAAPDVPFYRAMCRLPLADKVDLFVGGESELEQELERRKAGNSEKLAALFKKNYYWRDSGDRYIFNDARVNNDMFGLMLTKTQILAKLKNDNLPRKTIVQLLDWFETQEELTTRE